MPGHIKRPCSYPGCRVLVTAGKRCDTHKAATRRELDGKRPSAAGRGYGHRWRRARLQFLRLNPLCQAHLERDQYVQATVVDHIVPHRGDRALFWRRDNWQPLCKPCHDKKSGGEAHT